MTRRPIFIGIMLALCLILAGCEKGTVVRESLGSAGQSESNQMTQDGSSETPGLSTEISDVVGEIQNSVWELQEAVLENQDTEGKSRIQGSEKTIENADGEGTETESDGSNGREEDTHLVVIHVCGAVLSPGVYKLPAGSRVGDAVSGAGGFAADADMDYLNLAKVLIDGSQVRVPTVEEAAQGTYADGTRIGSGVFTEGGAAPGQGGADTTNNRDGSAGRDSGNESISTGTPKVNLNTADKAALMTLPGIGEAKAESILNYRREHGEFRSVEELMNIRGIKEGILGKIRDYVTL